MANIDKPVGAYPLRSLSGGEIRTTRYTAGGAIYRGDFVTLANDGRAEAAAAGNTLLGVAANYASGDGQNVDVYDDPNTVFSVQADATLAETNIGNNADILATAADTTYNRSKHELDASDAQTTTAQLRIVGLVDTPGNDWGADNDVEVIINEHYLNSATGV